MLNTHDCRNIARRMATLVGLSTLTVCAWAHDYRAGTLRIDHPWARPTVTGQAAGGGFLKITNEGPSADRLLQASTDPRVAQSMELHTMQMEGTVMQMREVDAIEVTPNSSTELKPGSYHLMFMGLKAPLTVGQKIPVTLKFEKAGELRIDFWVESPATTAAPQASSASR